MLLFRLAFRSLLLQRAKSLTIGAFLVFGTILILVGNAMLDAMDDSMSETIVRSITGHLQVYSVDAEDELKLFGNLDIGQKDYGAIHDFGTVRKTLVALPEVEDVVPMGVDNAVVFTGNLLDQRLADIRTALREEKSERISTIAQQVRRMLEVLREDWERSKDLINMERAADKGADELNNLDTALTDEFWNTFATEPLPQLEFLENKVAPLALDADLIWIGYIGTDMRVFEKTFTGFEIVDGTSIPPGKRGFLFNTLNYERQVKNKTARRLDLTLQKLEEEIPFEECEDCQTWKKQNVNQIASLLGQMDADAEKATREGLQKGLESKEQDTHELLKAVLSYDTEEEFLTKHALFYEAVAPNISLYSIPIGSTLTVSAFGRGGYVRKIPLKVYGVYRFRSIDGEAMAGGFNLMDLMSFRELYGYMTEERKQEIKDLRAEFNVVDHDRENIEDALFGEESDDLVEEGESTSFEATVAGGAVMFDEAYFNESFSEEEMESGVVLNAAVMLSDGVSVEAGRVAVENAIREAALPLQVTTWRKAAGMWGDFILVAQGILHGAVAIIFLVALLIINNTLMMSTLERTKEIGTMRAIGAQRGFVRGMIFTETGILAVIFGGLGVLLGCGIVALLTWYGIPPWNDVTRFFFAGGHLRPDLALTHVVWALGSIVFVSVAATIYPVYLATRITPLVAMQAED